MTARTRHVRPQGQPRRAWAPLDPDVPRTLPVFVPAPQLLDAEQTQAVLDRFALDLWVATRKAHGVSEALNRLAPGHGRRLARRVGRRLRSAGLDAMVFTAYVCVVVGGPLAYGVGL